MFATIDTDNGVQLTCPSSLRDLGDAIRRAAQMMDGQQQ